MSTQTRRRDRGLGKTAAGGNTGSYAGHERAAAAPPGGSGRSCPAHGFRGGILDADGPEAQRDGCTCARVETGLLDAGTVTSTWIERNVLPTPRHRVPRDVYTEFETSIPLRTVALEDTGEAFSFPEHPWSARDGVPDLVHRHFDGQLWTPVRRCDTRVYREGDEGFEDRFSPLPATPGDTSHIIHRVSHQSFSSDEHLNQESASSELRAHGENYLVIDGELWRTAGEPGYEVRASDRGWRDSSRTSLSTVDSLPNLNRNKALFTLDEFEDAKEYALSIAERQGDEESAAQIRRVEPSVVVSPERPWRHPVSAKRLLGAASRDDIDWEQRDDLQLHEEKFTDLKRRILDDAPEAIYTDSDGRRRINFEVVTEDVQLSYEYFAKRTHELSQPKLDQI